MSDDTRLSATTSQMVDEAIAACTKEDSTFLYWDVLHSVETRLKEHDALPAGLDAKNLARMVLSTYLHEHDAGPSQHRDAEGHVHLSMHNVARLRGDRLIRVGKMRRAQLIEHVEVMRNEQYRRQVDNLVGWVQALADLVIGPADDTKEDDEA
jgi:hypothetical protein